MARGTDAAIIINLLKVQVGFIDSYLATACKAKDDIETRALDAEPSLDQGWKRSQNAAKAAAELEKQVKDLKRQIEFTQIQLDGYKKELENYCNGEDGATTEPSGM